MDHAVPRMRAAFSALGWNDAAVNEVLFAELKITEEEVVTLRLYTGPMFMVYNTVLRAMATDTKTIRFGVPQSMLGLSVKGRFVTTLHATNSGVIKLSRLQPACEVYRGVRGMKLPRSFVTANAHNVRGGVENSFLSATTDLAAALKYARVSDDGPSLIFCMRMGMVNRGAYLGWLSQYPDEREILIPVRLAACSIEEAVSSASRSQWQRSAASTLAHQVCPKFVSVCRIALSLARWRAATDGARGARLRNPEERHPAVLDGPQY